jgi:hypothetical protein
LESGELKLGNSKSQLVSKMRVFLQLDKLEEAEQRRLEEGPTMNEKPIMMGEPQLMLTAGPMAMGGAAAGMYQNPAAGAAPYANAYGVPPSYPGSSYGM